MLDLYYDLCRKLDEELVAIDRKVSDILKKSEQSVLCIFGYLEKLKKNVHKHGFHDNKSEIMFFKNIKPMVFHQLIYYTKILSIESAKPSDGKQLLKKFYRSELKKLSFFYRENKDFCQYYRKGLTHLDHIYFMRGKFILGFLNDTTYFVSDPSFSTTHDYKVSCILAYDKLAVYLQDSISISGIQTSVKLNNIQNLNWTDSKIALVELIYALHTYGCLNFGKLEIKDLAIFFSQGFSVEIGDYYRHYLEIKNRQNPTKFLDQLRDSLIKKIEQQDN